MGIKPKPLNRTLQNEQRSLLRDFKPKKVQSPNLTNDGILKGFGGLNCFKPFKYDNCSILYGLRSFYRNGLMCKFVPYVIKFEGLNHVRTKVYNKRIPN